MRFFTSFLIFSLRVNSLFRLDFDIVSIDLRTLNKEREVLLVLEQFVDVKRLIVDNHRSNVFFLRQFLEIDFEASEIERLKKKFIEIFLFSLLRELKLFVFHWSIFLVKYFFLIEVEKFLRFEFEF